MTYNSPFSQKTLNILKASLPFISPGMQRMVSNFVKIQEFNIMVKNLNDSLDSTISACEYNSAGETGCHSFNPTDFISAIKPYLNDGEKELIDMFLNMMNAINIYNVYKTLPSVAAPFSQNFDSHEYDNPDSISGIPDSDILNDSVVNSEYQDSDNQDSYDSDTHPSDESSERTFEDTGNSNNFNIETLKSLLSPSQRAMFETYSTLLNSTNSNAG